MKLYLDHAATSFPKPQAVVDAVSTYLTTIGIAAGRGGHARAVAAAGVADRCRERIARVLGVADPTRVVFGLNATDALNLAIKGVVRRGDRVVTTAMEHNSVLRPLAALARDHAVTVESARADGEGVVDLEDLAAKLRGGARLLAITHASNVCGALQPVAEAARLAKDAGALVLLDAAQTAGCREIDPAALGVDMVACAGHKGLLGPLGTGALWVAPGVEPATLREGGTGTRSEDEFQPSEWPARHESGSQNLPGLAGLAAGVDVVLGEGLAAIRERRAALAARFLEGAAGIAALEVLGPRDPARREPVFSVKLPGLDAHETATLLESEFEIEVRAGLHCAPAAHRAFGTLARGGTARLSFGHDTTDADVDRALAALAALAAA
jgi:cysteine desulfurase/selenocysteine lyase